MTIALDIDGTITDIDHFIPDSVALYFQQLYREGWQFVFITGRIFSFALMTLNKLTFPYLLALQNGAELLDMPGKQCIHRSYLNFSIIPLLDELYKEQEDDFLIYVGYDKGDYAYFRPDRFTAKMLAYLKKLERVSAKPWKAVNSFEQCGKIQFPLIKCIGSRDVLELLDQQLQPLKVSQKIKTTIICDPISQYFYFALITCKDADKGKAIQKFMEHFSLKRPLITAGDDYNDIPLFQQGDVCIAMDGSPEPLQNLAHIIAPPAHKKGIIEGLQNAIKKI